MDEKRKKIAEAAVEAAKRRMKELGITNQEILDQIYAMALEGNLDKMPYIRSLIEQEKQK